MSGWPRWHISFQNDVFSLPWVWMQHDDAYRVESQGSYVGAWGVNPPFSGVKGTSKFPQAMDLVMMLY